MTSGEWRGHGIRPEKPMNARGGNVFRLMIDIGWRNR
jgi:hypothetical protein